MGRRRHLWGLPISVSFILRVSLGGIRGLEVGEPTYFQRY